MINKCIFAMLLSIFLPASSFAIEYYTSCEIEDGLANGYVTVDSYDSLTISGTVSFKIYDKDFRLIDEDSSYEYEYIYNDTALVDELRVDSEAVHCTFDISQAIDVEDEEEDDSSVEYETMCEIRNGVAYGYVIVSDFGSLTISGTVRFYLFDEDRELIDEESSYEYEYIYNETELVDEVSVDSDVASCVFDVSEAI